VTLNLSHQVPFSSARKCRRRCAPVFAALRLGTLPAHSKIAPNLSHRHPFASRCDWLTEKRRKATSLQPLTRLTGVSESREASGLPPSSDFGVTCRRVHRCFPPADGAPSCANRLSGSANHGHAVFLELLVARHHRQVVQFGGGNDEAVKRIVVDGWQFCRRDAGIQSEGKNG
jgi:hypothetical protein